jgi:hypothetical protein
LSSKNYLENFGFLKVLFLTGLVITTITYYNQIYILYKEVSTIKGLFLIGNKILLMSSKKYPLYNYKGIHILKEFTIIIKTTFDKILTYFF